MSLVYDRRRIISELFNFLSSIVPTIVRWEFYPCSLDYVIKHISPSGERRLHALLQVLTTSMPELLSKGLSSLEIRGGKYGVVDAVLLFQEDSPVNRLDIYFRPVGRGFAHSISSVVGLVYLSPIGKKLLKEKLREKYRNVPSERLEAGLSYIEYFPEDWAVLVVQPRRSLALHERFLDYVKKAKVHIEPLSTVSVIRVLKHIAGKYIDLLKRLVESAKSGVEELG